VGTQDQVPHSETKLRPTVSGCRWAPDTPIPGMVPGKAPEIDPADMALIMGAHEIQQCLGMLGDHFNGP
jgi:hypothetical protein